MVVFGGLWMNYMFLIFVQLLWYLDVYKYLYVVKLLLKVEGDDLVGMCLKFVDDLFVFVFDGLLKFVVDGLFMLDGYGVNMMVLLYQLSYVLLFDLGNVVYVDLVDYCVMLLQGYVMIGDCLLEKNIDWVWYSGVWQYVFDYCDMGMVFDFQYYYQLFNYFVNYVLGIEVCCKYLCDVGFGDELLINYFIVDIDVGCLLVVMFYKLQGNLNMYVGYVDIELGDCYIVIVIDYIWCGL